MSAPTIEAWIIHAMDVYDKQGLYPGCTAFGQVQSFAAEAAETDRSVALDEIHHVLELFIQGLAGRPLKIEAAAETGTDTATLFLPERAQRFRRDVRIISVSTRSWRPTCGPRPGTGRFACRTTKRRWPSGSRASTRRTRRRAGFTRSRPCASTPVWRANFPVCTATCGKSSGSPATCITRPPGTRPSRGCKNPAPRSRSTRAWLTRLHGTEVPNSFCYQGLLLAERAQQVMQERIAREKELFRQALSQARRRGSRQPGRDGDRHDAEFAALPRRDDSRSGSPGTIHFRAQHRRPADHSRRPTCAA